MTPENPLLLPRMVWQVALGVTLILIVVWLVLRMGTNSRMKRMAGKEQALKGPIEEGGGPAGRITYRRPEKLSKQLGPPLLKALLNMTTVKLFFMTLSYMQK